MSDDPQPGSSEPPSRPRIATWKKLLLVLSVLLMLGGGALSVYSMVRGDDVGVDAGSSTLRAPGFAPGGDPSTVEPGGAPGGLEAWSPTIFRSGFSFFIGFCVGYAARTFLKISILVIGVVALAAFGLQYAGIIDVNWDALSGHYDSIADWLRDQTSSFTGFIKGHLPSTGLAAFGLLAGFRKG